MAQRRKHNLSNSQKALVKEKFDFLIEKLNEIALTNGISDIKFEGIVVKSDDEASKLICPCGTETYIDQYGTAQKRCKKC